MTGPLIRDIPSIKENLENIENFRALRQIMPLLRPILKLLKVDVDKMEDAFANFDELERMADELATVPDRFNDLFSERGWIIYDLMNFEVAKAAVEKAEAGDIDGAEADLVEYYDVGTVSWKLGTMRAVAAFRPRLRLAEKALEDYQDGRYHACIPVVLALLDGMVSEVHERRRGFFAEDTNLEAWDSMAAHSKGLNVLAGIFKKGRRKTCTEPITIPYRHGIMHGMDLGYDNKMVAAKSWAALFAARDWAIKAERGELEAPPEEPKASWRELLQQMACFADDRKRMEQWRPRDLRLGESIPLTGAPDAFEDETPERKLAEFLFYWKARNYGYMARCVSPDPYCPENRMPSLIREIYDSKCLRAFEFEEVNDLAAAVTVIETRLSYEEGGREVEEVVAFRMMCEDSTGKAAVRGKPGSSWSILNWRAIW